MGYAKVTIFKGSCPHCGTYQEIKDDRCMDSGCLVLHSYSDPVCEECGGEI